MFARAYQKLTRFTGILFILAVVVFLNGCQKDNGPVTPQEPALRTVTLNPNVKNNPQAKATGLVIELVGLNDNDERVGPVIDPIVVETPTYPLEIDVSLYVPPCRYLVTVTTALSREAARVEEGILNMCGEATVDVSVDTFEKFEVEGARIDAPASAEAGETIRVGCGIETYDAPDSERAELTITLSERNGKSFSETITPQHLSVSGFFPDPYARTSAENTRQFTCTIDDGRSTPQKLTESVRRNTALCEVLNEHDSGAGSLRSVLENAESNGCSEITFAAGVSTITNTSLPIDSGPLTLNGGNSGVTISGDGNGPAFTVNSEEDMSFQNLTITNSAGIWIGAGNATVTIGQGMIITNNTGGIGNFGGSTVLIKSGATISHNGNAHTGGGIFNTGGTVTVESGATISNNQANFGGGIYSDGGTVLVYGTISDNTGGGGICISEGLNSGTILTVYGTISHNTGGGISAGGTATVTIASGAKISNNTEWAGIFYGGAATVSIESGATISGNTSSDAGGGIANVGGGTIIVNGTVTNNEAAGDGGGIVNFNGTIQFGSSNLLENNRAGTGKQGGGIFNWDTITGSPNYGSGNTPNDCDGPGGCP